MVYEIFKNGKIINTIVAGDSFVKAYCKKNGYTCAEVVHEPTTIPDPEPTELEQLRADLDYIAALTGVEL